jgi:hypothetical protein
MTTKKPVAKAVTGQQASEVLSNPDQKKHSVKFSSTSADPLITSLYLMKSAAKNAGIDLDKASQIRVTIEVIA